MKFLKMEINPAPVNIVTKRFVNYIHTKNCDVNIVKQMILRGANVNYRDCNLNTPIHIALQHCNDKFNLVFELLGAGTHLNAWNKQKNSALHYAVLYCDDIDVLQVLIARRADVELRDCDNNSPLHLAVQNNKHSFVEALIQSGAGVNVRNSKGETPLIIAVRNNDLEIVKVLLSSEACVELADESMLTPLHVAVKSPKPNQSILIELVKHGARLYPYDTRVGFPLEQAVLKYYADPSENLLSAKTLIKCAVLKKSPGVKSFCKEYFVVEKYDIYPKLVALGKACLLESKVMQSEMIHKNFSLLDFLQEGFGCNPMFLKKTAYKELIFNQVLYISRNYPVYSDIIAYHLGKKDLCLKSMELDVYTSRKCLEGIRRIFLIPDAVFLIAGYLSSEDVLNLITAFSDSKHFATHDFGFQNLALGKSIKRKLNENC